MPLFQPQRDMLEWHGPGVASRPAGRARPKVGNGLQVRRPVLDVRSEDRRDFLVLPNVGVEIPQQVHQPGPTAETVEQGGGWRIFSHDRGVGDSMPQIAGRGLEAGQDRPN